MLGLNEKVTSVDTTLAPDSDKPLLETLADQEAADPESWLQQQDLNGSIEDWLSLLPEKQSEVLARRFGLRGYEMSTLEEVGKEIGLTRERVRQIQVEALRKLRDIVERQGLSGEDLFN